MTVDPGAAKSGVFTWIIPPSPAAPLPEVWSDMSGVEHNSRWLIQ